MELTEVESVRQARPDLSKLRVLIVHDWLVDWRGSERCVEQMLRVFPQADLVVGILGESARNLNDVTRRAKPTWLSSVPGAQTHHRWFLPLEGFAFRSLDTDEYDLVISSSHALSKMVRRPANGVHVCYCYSPPRYLWDLHEDYREHGPLLQSIALGAFAPLLRRLDRAAADSVDQFMAISRTVAERVRRAYGREAVVVFPPVAPKSDKDAITCHREDFVLSFGRLVPYKRVDLAIRASERAGVRLVIAGDGPERRRLTRMAGSNVQFLGEITESEAARLLSQCRALLFCGEEDFGIAPLEANAHGTPVVYLRRGGVAETMQEGVSGIGFDEPSPESAASAIQTALSTNWSASRLMENASRFSAARFAADFTGAVRQVLEPAGKIGG